MAEAVPTLLARCQTVGHLLRSHKDCQRKHPCLSLALSMRRHSVFLVLSVPRLVVGNSLRATSSLADLAVAGFEALDFLRPFGFATFLRL